MLETRPRYGRLDIYSKQGAKWGAAFMCEEDGWRYGVTLGVRERFSEQGSHHGWGYLNPDQTTVFKFIPGDASSIPDSLFAIETSEGLVDLRASAKCSFEYTDGAFVAFHARRIKLKSASQTRWQATDIFPLDGKHLPLVARLITTGRLAFPRHDSVLEIFFEGLPKLQNLDRQHIRLFESALARLANDSAVSGQFRTLAKVERSKLNMTIDAETQFGHASTTQVSQKRSSPEPASAQRRICRSSDGAVVDDVMYLNLQVQED